MDLITGALIVGAAWAFLGGKKKTNGNGQIWDLPDVDEGEEEGEIQEGEADTGFDEPDYQPGPIDKKKLVPAPVDDTWIKDLEALITVNPTPNRFWQIYKNGPNASDVARSVLQAKGINSGSNRVALVKCMTQIPWNAIHYASTREAKSWGTQFNVDGKNLSAAWLPRHAPAMQLLAMKERVPRNINEAGAWLGGDSKYGLIWIPRINDIQGKLVCDPLAEAPPKWLIGALKD